MKNNRLSPAQKLRIMQFDYFCGLNGLDRLKSQTLLDRPFALRLIKRGLLVEDGKNRYGQRLYRYTQKAFDLVPRNS